MFNFETTWRKCRRLEGEVLNYENKAKQDAFKIMQLQDIIKNLETELTQATTKICELQNNNNKPNVIKLKTKKGTK